MSWKVTTVRQCWTGINWTGWWHGCIGRLWRIRIAGRIVLIDGTLVPTWDWASEGATMFSGKHRDTGFNLQVAATLSGDLLAVSAPVPEAGRATCMPGVSPTSPKSSPTAKRWGTLDTSGPACSPAAANRPARNDPSRTGRSTSPSRPARSGGTGDRAPQGLENPPHPLPRPHRLPSSPRRSPPSPSTRKAGKPRE